MTDSNQKDINKNQEESKYNKCLFVLNKAEKIVNASYIVTNILDNFEPMKWSIREECQCLLKDSLRLKDIQSKLEVSHHIDKLKNSILALLSFFEISGRSNILSLMNCSIIKDELLFLSRELNEMDIHIHQMSDGQTNAPNSFGSQYISSLFYNSLENKSIESELLFEDASSVGSKFSPSKFNYSNEKVDTKKRVVSQSKINSKTTSASKSGISSSKRTVGVDNNKSQRATNAKSGVDRKDQILRIIKDKKEVSIKDISDIIKDCSEKTIQRELISMVDNGLLLKEGERRWSKYRIS